MQHGFMFLYMWESERAYLQDGEQLVDTGHVGVLVVAIEEPRLAVVDHRQFVRAAHPLDRVGVGVVIHQPYPRVWLSVVRL
jgi:hypothetical protein